MTLLELLFRQHWDQPALVNVTANPSVWTFGQLYVAASQFVTMPAQATVAFVAQDRLTTVLTYLAGWIKGSTLVPLDADYALPLQQHYAPLAEATEWFAEQPTIMPPADMPVCPDAGLFALPDSGCPVRFLTSGTSAMPKVVVHRLDKMLANVAAFNQALGQTPSYTHRQTLGQVFNPPAPMLHVMPLHYMAGVLNCLLAPWQAGQPVILAPAFSAETATRLDAMLTHPLVKSFSPVDVWLSPTMLAMVPRLIKTPERRQTLTNRLNHVLVGTAPLPSAVQQQFEIAFSRPCLVSYGMSEVLLVSLNQTGEPDDAVGTLLPGIQVRTDEQGQLWLASDYAMTGYLNQPNPFKPDAGGLNWLPTGDLGQMQQARLTITGRLKDLIIRGGINISPQAVETVLLQHPAVTGAAVWGQPDPFWGETVQAAVETPTPDNEALTMALQQHCHQHLPPYAQPASLKLVTQLPRTSTGKVQKHLLQT